MFLHFLSSIPVAWRFLAGFGAFSVLLLVTFSQWEIFLSSGYIYLVSFIVAYLLNELGLLNDFDASSLDQGFCALVLDNHLFHVTAECTGYFTLLVYLGGVALYPAPLIAKIWGWGVGALVFLAYSIGRIVVLGIIALWFPTWLKAFHTYLMVVFNLGFVCFLWAAWIQSKAVKIKE